MVKISLLQAHASGDMEAKFEEQVFQICGYSLPCFHNNISQLTHGPSCTHFLTTESYLNSSEANPLFVSHSEIIPFQKQMG